MEIFIVQRIIPYESENIIFVSHDRNQAQDIADELQKTLHRFQTDLKYVVKECRTGRPLKENLLLENEEKLFGEN